MRFTTCFIFQLYSINQDIQLEKWTRLNNLEGERKCLICKNYATYPTNDPVLYHLESEIHYLFICRAYNLERNQWLRKLTLPPDFDQLTIDFKLKIVLNDPNNVKLTSQFITIA